MDKNQNVAVESEVETTTQTSSPQVEVPATEEQTALEQTDQSTQEQVTDVTEENADPREFQIKRLSEENRRLKAEREVAARPSAFDAFRPNYQAPAAEQAYDPYVEAPAVDARVVNQMVDQTVTERLDEYQARQNFPELFADPEIEQEIADRWFAAKMRGDNLSVSAVSEKVATRFRKAVFKAEKLGAEKALQEVTVKEQAGLSASGQTSQGARAQESIDDLEELSAQTRVGNQDAIVARMKAVPWANK